MSGGEFQPGQSVYSRDGHKFYVRELLPDGRLLTSQFFVVDDYESGEQEYPSDSASIKIVSEMFAKAPTAVIDADVAKARLELDSIRALIKGSRDAARDAERDSKAIIDRLAKAPSFTRLFDYIEGKITHVVCSEYQHAAVIKPWAEFAAYQESRERQQGIKLLTLFGDTEGNTEWRLNRYRDGSGGWETCQPCTSEEEALTVVGEWLEAAWLTFSIERPWFLSGAINSADKYGFPVPQHVRDAHTRHEVDAHLRAVAKCEADLTAAKDRLVKATGQ